MLRHHLLIIFRSFNRFKTSFLINLIGLSSGLASVLLVYLWVNDELLVDKFHVHDARLYQLFEYQKNSQASIRVTNSTPGLLAETIQAESPEVEAAVTATPSDWFDKFTLSIGETTIDSRGIYASRDYFKIFSYDLLHGDANKVLADKNGIVITEETAMALFKTTENLIGKAIDFQHERQFYISGILKNLPSRSSTQFDFVLSFEIFKEVYPQVVKWENSSPMTFVLLKEKADVDLFNKKIAHIIGKHVKEQHRSLISRQYSDVYLRDNYNDEGVQEGGRIEYVIMFSIIAAFILAIACINFMNLSTAKASRRIKEVGIKKAIGANRRTLIFQYMGESMLMSFLSLFLAILIVDIFLPRFNIITGKHLSLDVSGGIVMAFFTIAFITGLVAGSYPALYLSGFNPAVVLKGKSNTSVGELWARKGLVVFQFSLSVI
ncbi:MAG TPA: ABC transporter permease, partial [Chryseolinea sp.]|nr:ABC transporter permease [Chryseolinea sp.]